MIIVDTNVLSELMKQQPDARLLEWAQKTPSDQIWTTAICVAEINFGLQRLPTGKRRQGLLMALGQLMDNLGQRVLAFDRLAANHFGILAAEQERSGFSVGLADLQIAAIVAAHQGILATRNIKDFQNFEIKLFNPWE